MSASYPVKNVWERVYNFRQTIRGNDGRMCGKQYWQRVHTIRQRNSSSRCKLYIEESMAVTSDYLAKNPMQLG